ncbi:MAG: deaminase [Leptonema sp. (in: bacteria)]
MNTFISNYPPKELCDLMISISQKVAKRNQEIPVVAILCTITKEKPKGLFFNSVGYWKIEAISTNLVRKKKDVKYHAEYVVLEKYKKKSKNFYFSDLILIVNLEPCYFCYSLITLYRIKKIFYFVRRNKNLSGNDILGFSLKRKSQKKKKFLNHHTELIQLKEYSTIQKNIIRNFFKRIRKIKKINL